MKKDEIFGICTLILMMLINITLLFQNIQSEQFWFRPIFYTFILIAMINNLGCFQFMIIRSQINSRISVMVHSFVSFTFLTSWVGTLVILIIYIVNLV